MKVTGNNNNNKSFFARVYDCFSRPSAAYLYRLANSGIGGINNSY